MCAGGYHNMPLGTFSDDTSLLIATCDSIRKTNAFLELLKPLANEKKVTLAQLALRWALDRPGITCVLAGSLNSAQAIENARAANIMLSKKDMNTISSALMRLEVR